MFDFRKFPLNFVWQFFTGPPRLSIVLIQEFVPAGEKFRRTLLVLGLNTFFGLFTSKTYLENVKPKFLLSMLGEERGRGYLTSHLITIYRHKFHRPLLLHDLFWNFAPWKFWKIFSMPKLLINKPKGFNFMIDNLFYQVFF